MTEEWRAQQSGWTREDPGGRPPSARHQHLNAAKGLSEETTGQTLTGPADGSVRARTAPTQTLDLPKGLVL